MSVSDYTPSADVAATDSEQPRVEMSDILLMGLLQNVGVYMNHDTRCISIKPIPGNSESGDLTQFMSLVEMHSDPFFSFLRSTYERLAAFDYGGWHDQTYQDYLLSPQWKQQRDKALKSANYRCAVCDSESHLQVHHRSYERIYRELASDLTVLCDVCHDTFHRNGRIVKHGGR